MRLTDLEKTNHLSVVNFSKTLLIQFFFCTGLTFASTIAVTDSILHQHGGWGLMPAAIDRELPTYSDGSQAWGDVSWLGAGAAVTSVMDTVLSTGFDIARIYISPTVGKPDHTLDADRLQDIKDYLTILKSKGITRYITTVWSPPAYMKLPDRVRYGTYQGRNQYLDSTFTEETSYSYPDYYVSVLKDLRTAGFAAPLAVSIQNEPGMDAVYDGCIYDADTWIKVAKLLRKRLDENGFSQTVLQAAESMYLGELNTYLGAASSSGFSRMTSDPVLDNAIGAFSFHSYATAGNTSDLKAAFTHYPNKKIWMTEYSSATGVRAELLPNSGNIQLDNAIVFFQRMGGDIVDFGVHYWFFWRGWRAASALYDQDLVAGGPGSIIVDKPYYAFKRLWTTVKPGWNVMRTTSTDPELRTDNDLVIYNHNGDEWSAPVHIVGFRDSSAQASFLVLTNSYATSKVLQSVSGLKGDRAIVYRFDLTHNGNSIRDTTVHNGVLQGGNLTLPAYSITMISATAINTTKIQKANTLLNKQWQGCKLHVDLHRNSVLIIDGNGHKFCVNGARSTVAR